MIPFPCLATLEQHHRAYEEGSVDEPIVAVVHVRDELIPFKQR